MAKMEPSEWAAVMAVHLNGAYNVTRPAFIKMREQGYGRIVVTTSASGLYGNFGQTNYAAAKMGLVGFMNTVKLEGEKYNIKVNAIAPVAATRLTEDLLPPDMLERLQPELVAPMVLYLCWEGCSETGMIFNAGMGCFNRAAVVSGPGTVVGDGITPPTPEQIHQNWEAINKLEPAIEPYSATEALSSIIDAFSSKGAQSDSVPKVSVKSVFDSMSKAFLPEKAAGVDVVFQFRITGPTGGEWFATIKDATCTVQEGCHQKPTTTIIMADGDFVDLITGKLNAMKAFTSGKLKIEGDLMKSQLIEKLFRF